MHLTYFYKTDCQPCAEKKPLAEAIASAAGLPLEYVNTDDAANADLVAACRVKAVPTLCVVENGKRVAGFYGKMISQPGILRFLGL